MNFVSWKVMIDIGFWTRLTKKKIQEYKLDSTARPLTAKYRLSNKPQKLSVLSIDAYSFGDTTQQDKSGPVQFKISGEFINTNTIEQFNSFDIEGEEKNLLEKQYQKIQAIANGTEIDWITEIKLLTFGDFKKHTFKYQFLSTAIPLQGIQVRKVESASIACADKIQKINQFIKVFTKNGKQPPQFSVLKDYEPSSIKQFINAPKEGGYMFCICDSLNFQKHTGYHTSTVLSIFAYLRQKNLVPEQCLEEVRVLFLKQFFIFNMERNYSLKSSEVYSLNLSKVKRGEFQNRISHKQKAIDLDLKSWMDDKSLAKEAVDLNIKLMKWRLLPSLDIPKIQSKKCLLFGAGTLGCQLSRNLIGWGIKNITFVDYSKVSYSNPVRQTLYEFEDTKGGGKPKAETAAEKLIKIYPEINAKGYNLQVPMPGHYVTKEEHIKQTFDTLDFLQNLVKEHDVLFLLLDSRQARWLPTVLANKYDKACITVGLGFDSFVIVRHGVSPSVFEQEKHKERICCYFCNDIITPQNTMKDRTLDQQCTVTRPGLSFLASAYASELYISLIHHPLEHHVWAHEDSNKLQNTDLGKLPNHIRGNMSDFESQIFYGKAFEKCVACSEYIWKEYSENRDEFMLKVLNDPSFIHEVVKLKDELEEFEKTEYNIIEIIDDEEEMAELQ